MKKILIVILFSTSIFAQSAGGSGLSFLKLGFGARNVAMGDLGVVTAQDVTSLHYNPALLSEYSSSEILFTHNQWIQDVRSELLGVSFKFLGLPLALGINTTTIPDIEVRTKPGEADAKFNANYFAGSISTGVEIVNNISAGITVKYLYESLLSDESTGMGFDFGLFYKSPIEGLSFGTAVRNVGKLNKLRSESTKLPTDFTLGSSYNTEIEELNSIVTIAGALEKYTATDDTHFNFGGELFYDDLLALRAGYQTGYISKGFSAGVGLKWYNLSFDYAFTPYSLNLGTTQNISIKFKF